MPPSFQRGRHRPGLGRGKKGMAKERKEGEGGEKQRRVCSESMMLLFPLSFVSLSQPVPRFHAPSLLLVVDRGRTLWVCGRVPLGSVGDQHQRLHGKGGSFCFPLSFLFLPPSLSFPLSLLLAPQQACSLSSCQSGADIFPQPLLFLCHDCCQRTSRGRPPFPACSQ